MYAHWVNNPRIKALLPQLDHTETLKLEAIRRGTPPKLLFLGPPPAVKSTTSDIGIRMNMLFFPIDDCQLPDQADYHVWNAKVQMFTVAASTNMVSRLNAQSLFALALFTGESHASVRSQTDKHSDSLIFNRCI